MAGLSTSEYKIVCNSNPYFQTFPTSFNFGISVGTRLCTFTWLLSLSKNNVSKKMCSTFLCSCGLMFTAKHSMLDRHRQPCRSVQQCLSFKIPEATAWQNRVFLGSSIHWHCFPWTSQRLHHSGCSANKCIQSFSLQYSWFSSGSTTFDSGRMSNKYPGGKKIREKWHYTTRRWEISRHWKEGVQGCEDNYSEPTWSQLWVFSVPEVTDPMQTHVRHLQSLSIRLVLEESSSYSNREFTHDPWYCSPARWGSNRGLWWLWPKCYERWNEIQWHSSRSTS